jgi:uncharacterized protein YciI
MRLKLIVLFVILPVLYVLGCDSKSEPEIDSVSEQPVEVDKSDYHTYYIGLVGRGANWTEERTDVIVGLQQKHIENINRLVDSGLIVLSGPIVNQPETENLAALFFFDVESLEQAQQLINNDPAVQFGYLNIDIIPWQGLSEIIYIEPPQMTVYTLAIFSKGKNYTQSDAPNFVDLLENQVGSLLKETPTGEVALAGPFIGENQFDITSLFIFGSDSLAQVERAVQSLEYVRSGMYDVKLLDWYGPMGLGFKKE